MCARGGRIGINSKHGWLAATYANRSRACRASAGLCGRHRRAGPRRPAK